MEDMPELVEVGNKLRIEVGTVGRYRFYILKTFNLHVPGFQNFQKCTRAIYPKLPSQTCDYLYKLFLIISVLTNLYFLAGNIFD